MLKTDCIPKKARRIPAVRLLLLLIFLLFLTIWLYITADTLAGMIRRPLSFTASPAAVNSVLSRQPAQDLLDINTASAEELDSLPGIGPSLAQAILEHRALHGGFCYIEEITDVPGIGEKRFEALRPLITCVPYPP